jgi:membrane protease YdiL (CAAX protease family)
MISGDVQPSVPQLQGRSRVRLVFAWLIIVAIVVLSLRASHRAAESHKEEQLLVAEQTRIFAMLAMQMNSLQTGTNAAAIHEQMDLVIRQLDNSSRTPEDKIRLSVLAGELVGPDAALQRLAELEQSNPPSEVVLDIQTLRTVYGGAGPDEVGIRLRERLDQRYGYLGRLAFAYGVPKNKEPRKTLEAQALRFTVRASILVLSLAAIALLSLGLFTAACVWFFKGKIQAAAIPNTSTLQVFLEAFALYLLLFQVCGRVIRLFGGVSIHWTWITLLILPVVAKWITVRMPAQEFRAAIGWYRGRGFIRECAIGIAGYFAGLPLVALGCAVTLLLVRYTGTPAASPLINELNSGPIGIIALYALACVFAPIMEETMFRGVFFHHLRQRWSWLVSAAIVSVVFAMLHPQGWIAVPVLASIAIVLAALREWRGSLIAPIAAHACNNFLALTLALWLLR